MKCNFNCFLSPLRKFPLWEIRAINLDFFQWYIINEFVVRSARNVLTAINNGKKNSTKDSK